MKFESLAHASIVAGVVLASCACRASDSKRAADSLAADARDAQESTEPADLAVDAMPQEETKAPQKGLLVRVDPTFAAEENRLATPTIWAHGDDLRVAASRTAKGEIQVKLRPARSSESYTFLFYGNPESPELLVTVDRNRDRRVAGSIEHLVDVEGGELVLSTDLEPGEFRLDVRFHLRYPGSDLGATLSIDGQFGLTVPAVP